MPTTTLVGPDADHLASVRTALDVFTRDGDDQVATLRLHRALGAMAARTGTYDSLDAEPAGHWLDAYWVAFDAQDLLRGVRTAQAGGVSLTADDVRAVSQRVTRAMDVFEDAASKAPAPGLPVDEHGRYSPAPGTEYPFSVSDIARATAALLGPDWTAESGYYGVTGTVSGPYVTTFTFQVDYEGDLEIVYGDPVVDDNWPEMPELPDDVDFTDSGVYLVGACAPDGLDSHAERSAAVIRAVTGR
ncbi:hypothetical protein ABTY59_32020 [Streptomyces sp. NPDC096079]|uniref:hypothetical protein n=1 Tax=Streptomyces sp. NPDC096079 TaxID=3155820 RepID=UPI0033289114